MATSSEERILLSGPDVSTAERDALLRAFDGGWIAPLGPELEAFEHELAEYAGVESCVGLSSGTAALQLAMQIHGVKPGDEVVVQSATFAASAFSVVHAGATPVFADIDPDTWGLDVPRLATWLAERAAQDRLPAAVMPVDLYGYCGDYVALEALCASYNIPLIEDAAEGLGSITTSGRKAGSFGDASVFSFNGNKIITTSGGGALLGPSELTHRARFLATQAREDKLHYEHVEIGNNFRMSNILAALGRAQLAGLEPKIGRRTEINEIYRSSFPEFGWAPAGVTSRPNNWLSVAILPESITPADVCIAMGEHNIEARPFWKPMHQQPVFAANEMIGGEVSDDLFARGICLPSGSAMTVDQHERVIETLASVIALTAAA